MTRDYGVNTWNAMVRQAQALSDDDVKRHASVSRDNRHRCYSCFTCACLSVAETRKLFRKRIDKD